MKNNVKNVISTLIVLILVAGLFAALPLTATAAPAPVSGNPDWKADYSKSPNKGTPEPILWDRGNAAGDKIASNAHSADYPGLYFYWDDKQKDDGVLLVSENAFEYFQDDYTYTLSNVDKKKAAEEIKFAKDDPGFVLTAKNSNNYWGYKIAKSTGKTIDTVNGEKIYAYAIPKQIQYINPNNGKNDKEDLKNINMVFIDGKYKDASFEIIKEWYDEDGVSIADATGFVAAFSSSYKVGLNKVTFSDYVSAVKGKTITVTENAIKGFSLIKTVLNGNEVAKVTFNVKSGDHDDVVVFHNQKQWANIVIEKVWLDAEGNVMDVTTGLEAIFTINGDAAYVGDNQVKEGTYIVREELCTDGYDLVSDNNIVVIVAAGETAIVTFENQDPFQEPEIKLIKTVDGKIIASWLKENPQYTLYELGMVFTLYDANFVGGQYLRTGMISELTLGADGVIDIVNTLIRVRGADFSGTYIVVESFVPDSIAERIFVGPAPQMVITINVEGKLDVVDGEIVTFDYDALYTIVNGFGQGGYRISTLNYPGLNNNGDIFYIGVTNTNTNVQYASYCAHAGSQTFAGAQGCDGYLVAYSYRTPTANVEGLVDFATLISALNYIEDVYGNLDENRVITQTVIWALLGTVNVNSPLFEATALTAYEKDAICAILIAAQEGYEGNGKIADVVYMICKTHGDDEYGLLHCQPQLVPIYNVAIKNELVDNPTVDVSFTKTKYGGLWTVEANEFAFDLFAIVNGEEEYVDTYYTQAGGEVTAPDLKPGSYVFRETLAADLEFDWNFDFEVSYKPVWKAIYPNGDNGLYFEIDVTGEIIWKASDGFDGCYVPTVDNEYYCKHAHLWTVTKETEDSIPYGNGWIRFDAEHDCTYKASYIEATCYDGAGWLMQCPICGMISGGFYIVDKENSATGHDYVYDPVHPMWCTKETAGTLYRRCAHDNCNFTDQISDYDLWYELCVAQGWNPQDYGFDSVRP